RERREALLDVAARVRERGRKDERLPEPCRILVRREPGAERGDLEEDAARLTEVDGPEPEGIDDGRRPRAPRGEGFLPGRLILHRRGPGDVVHRPGAAHAAIGR